MIQAIITYTKLAVENLWYHKVRGALAMIGILVGTASVVALLTGGELATNNALSQFKTLGTNLLSMDINDKSYSSNTSQQQRQFQLSDFPTLQQASKAIHLMAPYITTYSSTSFHSHSLNAALIGATSNLSHLHLHIKQGRPISSLDIGRDYGVIGSDLAKQLKSYGVINPIGVQIQVGNTYYTVVGVLDHVTPTFFFASNLNTLS